MYLRLIAAWIVIIAIVSYDAMLTVKNGTVVLDPELAPLASWLLVRPGGVSELVAIESVLLAAAISWMMALWQNPKWRGSVVSGSLLTATFKLSLLICVWPESEWLRTRIPPQQPGFANSARRSAAHATPSPFPQAVPSVPAQTG